VNLYGHLQRIEPIIAGPWRWVTFAVVAGGLLLAAWAICSRRWRRDGVRRCERCRHPFDPGASFGAAGLRCNECGSVTPDERAALSRRGRAPVVAVGLVIAIVAAMPVLLWHGVHLLVARLVLPRWVTVEAATLPSGHVIALEGDPLQAWLRWAPNAWPGAWDGMFFEPVPDSDPPARVAWPRPWRLRVTGPGGSTVLPEAAGGHVRPVFGTMASESMPPAGTPGFGGALAPDGSGAFVVGVPNTGSGGGIEWHEVQLAGDGASVREIGWGMWDQPVLDGEWTFERRCHGFKYEMVPGVFLSDWDVTCAWDAGTRSWRADPSRMRRALRADFLDEMAHEARQGLDECLAGGTRVDDGGLEFAPDPSRTSDLPCPAMVGAISRGVMEHVFTGNAAGWRAWVRSVWPEAAGLRVRDAFIERMTHTIQECECAEVLRALNGVEGHLRP
jgi:hypothetical protein